MGSKRSAQSIQRNVYRDFYGKATIDYNQGTPACEQSAESTKRREINNVSISKINANDQSRSQTPIEMTHKVRIIGRSMRALQNDRKFEIGADLPLDEDLSNLKVVNPYNNEEGKLEDELCGSIKSKKTQKYRVKRKVLKPGKIKDENK